MILKGLRSYISCVVKSLSSEPNIGGIDIYLVTILGWPKSFNHDPEIAEVLPISNFSRTLSGIGDAIRGSRMQKVAKFIFAGRAGGPATP